jgi:hypothetical protein
MKINNEEAMQGMICPKCGEIQPQQAQCRHCGVMIAKAKPRPVASKVPPPVKVAPSSVRQIMPTVTHSKYTIGLAIAQILAIYGYALLVLGFPLVFFAVLSLLAGVWLVKIISLWVLIGGLSLTFLGALTVLFSIMAQAIMHTAEDTQRLLELNIKGKNGTIH